MHAADDPTDDAGRERSVDGVRDADSTRHVRFLESVERIEYDPETSSHRARYDAVVDAPSLVVVATVAASTGVGALDLPPLGETLDPESLDRVFGAVRDAAAVTFDFAHRRVTVDGEFVRVRPVAAGDLP